MSPLKIDKYELWSLILLIFLLYNILLYLWYFILLKNQCLYISFFQNIVDSFNSQNSGPRILLLSLTAGGVGLNLVGGNHLLLFDIHWNPQLEKQAQDRIYRFGQRKDVHIYKLVYCA